MLAQNGTGAPTAIQKLKLSKIDCYLVDNVALLRLSSSNGTVKQKTVGYRLGFGMKRRVGLQRAMKKSRAYFGGARVVQKAEQWPWSTYRSNAFRGKDAVRIKQCGEAKLRIATRRHEFRPLQWYF